MLPPVNELISQSSTKLGKYRGGNVYVYHETSLSLWSIQLPQFAAHLSVSFGLSS
uniref:Uncharacterized protein n=1 Tax=Arundo donax TaxID=35708 RepID=A0A0A9FZ32_ARUDO